MLSSLDHSPEVLILSETWLSSDAFVDGYNDFHTFRQNRRSGGVSVFCKYGYTARKMEEFCLSTDVLELCTVQQ